MTFFYDPIPTLGALRALIDEVYEHGGDIIMSFDHDKDEWTTTMVTNDGASITEVDHKLTPVIERIRTMLIAKHASIDARLTALETKGADDE